MNEALKLAALSMGYRLLGEGKYAKPMGHAIMVLTNDKLSQMFDDTNGDSMVWFSKEFNHGHDETNYPYVDQIADIEENYHTVWCSRPFPFTTTEEYFQELL